MLVSHGVHEDRLVRGVHPIYPQVKVSPEITLQQGAAHHRDEIQSPVAVKCSSCGKTSPSNSSHPVNYKTIIAHFEQVKRKGRMQKPVATFAYIYQDKLQNRT